MNTTPLELKSRCRVPYTPPISPRTTPHLLPMTRLSIQCRRMGGWGSRETSEVQKRVRGQQQQIQQPRIGKAQSSRERERQRVLCTFVVYVQFPNNCNRHQRITRLHFQTVLGSSSDIILVISSFLCSHSPYFSFQPFFLLGRKKKKTCEQNRATSISHQEMCNALNTAAL